MTRIIFELKQYFRIIAYHKPGPGRLETIFLDPDVLANQALQDPPCVRYTTPSQYHAILDLRSLYGTIVVYGRIRTYIGI